MEAVPYMMYFNKIFPKMLLTVRPDIGYRKNKRMDHCIDVKNTVKKIIAHASSYVSNSGCNVYNWNLMSSILNIANRR